MIQSREEYDALRARLDELEEPEIVRLTMERLNQAYAETEPPLRMLLFEQAMEFAVYWRRRHRRHLVEVI